MSMLSRVAENLFWIGRSVERAENTARLLDTARRMAAVPGPEGNRNEWSSILSSSGSDQSFPVDATPSSREDVVNHLAFSKTNPSSIYASLFQARENARSTREALPTDFFRVLNDSWMEFKSFDSTPITGRFLAELIDRTKYACMATIGALESTVLRNQIYDFIRLGTFAERADSTARILDVKYFSLLPPEADLDGGVDAYQWMTILDATSTRRVFRRLYGTDLRAITVTELLLQNEECARSIGFSIGKIHAHLTEVNERLGVNGDAAGMAAELLSVLRAERIDDIIAGGLHEFIGARIRDNNAIARQIGIDYHFSPPTTAAPVPAEPAGVSANQSSQQSSA